VRKNLKKWWSIF